MLEERLEEAALGREGLQVGIGRMSCRRGQQGFGSIDPLFLDRVLNESEEVVGTENESCLLEEVVKSLQIMYLRNDSQCKV